MQLSSGQLHGVQSSQSHSRSRSTYLHQVLAVNEEVGQAVPSPAWWLELQWSQNACIDTLLCPSLLCDVGQAT